jgi:hypothetical protein
MERVEASGSDEAFKLDEQAFPTFSDFSDTVLKDKIPSSGMYWGLFSVLVNMRPQGLSGKERADEQNSSEWIQTSALENSLLASMSHSKPACHYAKGGVGTLVELEEGFGACPSYAQWISGVEPVKKILSKQLKDFTAGILGNVDPRTGGVRLAKALLANVKAQWYELVSWIDEFYKQLTEEANFKAKPAWRWLDDALRRSSTLCMKRAPKWPSLRTQNHGIIRRGLCGASYDATRSSTDSYPYAFKATRSSLRRLPCSW